ncbi:MAG: phosphatidylinositol-4- kinase [Peltula sp. TS41687]|nr:MAG: phosphatidylinositol-4- kinase [Peltula sp. TS41687]
MSPNLRQTALAKLAALSATSQPGTWHEYEHEGALSGREANSGSHNCSDTVQGSDTPSGIDAKTVGMLLRQIKTKFLEQGQTSYDELRVALRQAAAFLCRLKADDWNLVEDLVGIPVTLFTKESIELGVSIWMSVINDNPKMESRIMAEVVENWECTVRKAIGMFDHRLHHKDPFYIKEEFAPSNREAFVRRQQFALQLVEPHSRLLRFLVSRFNATRSRSRHVQKSYYRLVQITLGGLKHPVGHPLTREVHFQFILFSLDVLRYGGNLDISARWRLMDQILSAALGWFACPPRWSSESDHFQAEAEIQLLIEVENVIKSGIAIIGSALAGSVKALQEKQDLVLLLLKTEQTRLMVWLHPLELNRKYHLLSGNHEKVAINPSLLPSYLRCAWVQSPALAIQLFRRCPSVALADSLRWLLMNFPEKALDEADSVDILLGSRLPGDVTSQLKYLLYWAPVDPITAVTYFLPAYGNHPFILQYAMRALESHSIEVTFFYVPQIVQTLRYDVLGYVGRYIIETAKFSQLFAHQIIWNMKANAYRDEDSQVPDPIKPTLDKVMESLISSFSGPDEAFYKREFSFFAEVTSISGKLRPFIKKTKAEKKEKIEEELRKIKVEVGVYLPSNPEGVIIGIDRKSGKPLQSHAKAPYMATFRVTKDLGELEGTEQMLGQVHHEGSLRRENTVEVWQSAIFKVGDDCRQDILALQLIAAFRGIFDHVGLDVYVYPYRVTATAPGCGVIDVLPNTISRDMLGREAVNDLYDYFVSKYGGEKSIQFQEARSNLVKSMAAYSVISYLLQFKDRHNGNIMIDDAGHILHIDFGFCFDIAPGGIRFERAPFKLTPEMVAVMGGSTKSQSYRWFESLCIKAFLASRPYAEKLVRIVLPMLDSGLPCFKPHTIKHFRERFVLEKSDREAADFMRDLIRKSYGSYSTKGYDQFQLMTNGIPY